jgi:hypothetical protein
MTYIDIPCECPSAGWCARHRMNKAHNLHSLCQQRNRQGERYRKLWDYLAPHSEETPPEEPHEEAAEPVFKKVGLGDLIGAAAKMIGFTNPCGGCKQRQAVLNHVKVPVPKRLAPVPETVWTTDDWPDDWGEPDPRWAVGVTTAYRAKPSLVRSLHSLVAAGWTDVRVFAEPGSVVPKWDGVEVHEQAKGVFQNWRFALETLRQEKPDAEFYFIAQDDVVYAKNLKAYLEADLWPSSDTGFVSPYRSAGKMVGRKWRPSEAYLNGKCGRWDKAKHGQGLWGALAYILPAESVKILLEDKGLKTRERMIDLAIHPILASRKRPALYANRSLAEHIGDVSSIGHGTGKGMNSGGSFPGEDFDCLSLLEGN